MILLFLKRYWYWGIIILLLGYAIYGYYTSSPKREIVLDDTTYTRMVREKAQDELRISTLEQQIKQKNEVIQELLGKEETIWRENKTFKSNYKKLTPSQKDSLSLTTMRERLKWKNL